MGTRLDHFNDSKPSKYTVKYNHALQSEYYCLLTKKTEFEYYFCDLRTLSDVETKNFTSSVLYSLEYKVELNVEYPVVFFKKYTEDRGIDFKKIYAQYVIIKNDFIDENKTRLEPPYQIRDFLMGIQYEQLFKILKKIPNFDKRFTKDQKSAMANYNNSLIIGRSGTGKTTVAILKLLAMELYCYGNTAIRNGKKSITG